MLALAPLPFVVEWIDPRPDAFPSHAPANATLRRPDEPVEALRPAVPGTFVLVMTHSHALDLSLVGAALGDDRFPYVGLIGSATKRARFEKRLAEFGIRAGADFGPRLPDRGWRNRVEAPGGNRRRDRGRASRPGRGGAGATERRRRAFRPPRSRLS